MMYYCFCCFGGYNCLLINPMNLHLFYYWKIIGFPLKFDVIFISSQIIPSIVYQLQDLRLSFSPVHRKQAGPPEGCWARVRGQLATSTVWKKSDNALLPSTSLDLYDIFTTCASFILCLYIFINC